jgi:phosphatidylglycerophosphate synthase
MMATTIETEAVSSGVERRPLALRDRRPILRVAKRLTCLGVTPNAISMIGLGVGVLSGVALAATAWVDAGLAQRTLWVAGALLIQLRGACNILDGVVAVESGQRTSVGLLYNEIPDRVSDAATLIGAGFALGGAPVLGWAAAVTAVFVAYVRVQCRTAGAPADYCGPMAKPMRMVIVVAAALYGAFAPQAWAWRWGPDDAWGVMAAALLIVVAGGLFTSWRRIARATRCLRTVTP